MTTTLSFFRLKAIAVVLIAVLHTLPTSGNDSTSQPSITVQVDDAGNLFINDKKVSLREDNEATLRELFPSLSIGSDRGLKLLLVVTKGFEFMQTQPDEGGPGLILHLPGSRFLKPTGNFQPFSGIVRLGKSKLIVGVTPLTEDQVKIQLKNLGLKSETVFRPMLVTKIGETRIRFEINSRGEVFLVNIGLSRPAQDGKKEPSATLDK